MRRIRVLPDIDKLVDKRVRLGMNQSEFAQKAGMSVSHVGMVESGERGVSPAVAQRMASALEIEFDDLFTIERGGGDV